MFAKETLANPDPAIAHCHCPAVANAPTGGPLVTWYAYPKTETRDGVLVLARKAAGRTRSFVADSVLMNHHRTEFQEMIRMLPYTSETLAEAGVEVYSCSPDSMLECFELA